MSNWRTFKKYVFSTHYVIEWKLWLYTVLLYSAITSLLWFLYAVENSYVNDFFWNIILYSSACGMTVYSIFQAAASISNRYWLIIHDSKLYRLFNILLIIPGINIILAVALFKKNASRRRLGTVDYVGSHYVDKVAILSAFIVLLIVCTISVPKDIHKQLTEKAAHEAELTRQELSDYI